MPFFTKKSPQELQAKFSQYSVKNLDSNTRIYESNLKKIEDMIVLLRASIIQLQNKLHDREEQLQKLKLDEPRVMAQEVERMKGLVDSNEDRSADNYAARAYYLNYSPLRAYEGDVEGVEYNIRELRSNISQQETKLETLKLEKSECKNILQILQGIIKSKQPEGYEELKGMVLQPS